MTHKADDRDIDYEINFLNSTASGDISYGEITFLRDKNPNGLAPALHQDKEGAWLRLAVAKGAYTNASAGDPDRCDRCELRDSKLQLGTPVWYSFELRAEFKFPNVDARCVCAQIKAPYYDGNGGSPLFALRIDRGRYVATVEHLYEAKDAPIVNGSEQSRYLRPYSAGGCVESVRAFDHHVFGNSPSDFKELQVRALLATDSAGLPTHLEGEFQSCTTGVLVEQESYLPDDIHEWHRFKICVAPTKKKDEDGIVQLFKSDPRGGDEVLVATARGEFGHVGYSNAKTNTGPIPGQAYQYFKVGPYRDKLNIWGDKVAAIHVRNIRRGPWPQGADLRSLKPRRR